MSAARLGAVYAALMAAHDVADHVAQTDHQAANKATSWKAMAGHVGSYQALQALALAALRPYGVRPAWWRVALATAWSAGTHALLDRRWPVKWLLEHTGSARFADARFVVRGSMAHAARWFGAADAQVAVDQATHPVPLHGPYLADQALHHACLFVAALILAGGR